MTFNRLTRRFVAILLLSGLILTACRSTVTTPPLISENELSASTTTDSKVQSSGIGSVGVPTSEPVGTVSAASVISDPTTVVASVAPTTIVVIPLTPTTVSPNRKASTGLDASDPALAKAIRDQVIAYQLAYFEEYLKLPQGDISSLTRFTAPESQSERIIKQDSLNIKKDDVRARRPKSNEVFVLDVGRILLISPTRVRVTACQANNLIAYYYGPPERIVEDRLVTVVFVNDYVLINGKWLEETQRDRQQYDGQQCDLIDR